MNIIKANNINHSYIFAQREIKSLYDISFKIEKGEFISIVGMNGCGKSTLVKHLNALIPLQSGELTIASLDCRNNKNIYKIRQKCGMVFQNPDNQFVSTVVKEDVEFSLPMILPSFITIILSAFTVSSAYCVIIINVISVSL